MSSSTQRVRVTLDIDVDAAAWALAFGTDASSVASDVAVWTRSLVDYQLTIVEQLASDVRVVKSGGKR